MTARTGGGDGGDLRVGRVVCAGREGLCWVPRRAVPGIYVYADGGVTSHSWRDTLPENPEQQTAEKSKTIPIADGVTLAITNIVAAKEWVKDFDSYQRFHLQVASDFFQKAADLSSPVTALYEKLILLNGAIIALSITFLGYLSSRVDTARLTERPHLWMVGVTWSLLIVSMYSCYRVLVDRHAAMLRLLGKVSRTHTEYLSQRLGVLLATIGKLVEGDIAVGSDRVEFSKLMELFSTTAKQEGDKQIKKLEATIIAGEKSYAEGAFAKLAIWSTLLAVGFLCTFTIRSLHLLF
jgi:hypothetical protein